MRIAYYIVLMALALMMAPNRTDVGKLRPVEVIAVSECNGYVTVRTDTGDLGKGQNLKSAMADMEDTTAGVIYLDTAEYLLLETQITEREELESILKSSVRVCAAQPGIELKGIGSFLDIHAPRYTMKEGTDYGKLEILWEEEGRYCLQ